VLQVLVQAPPGRLLRRMPARREFSSLAAAAAVTGGTECFAEYFTNPVSRRPCFKELRLIALPTTLNKGSLLTRSGARDFNGNGSRVSASFGLWFAEPSRSGTAGFRSNSPLKTGTRPIHQASWPSPAFRPAADQANGMEIPFNLIGRSELSECPGPRTRRDITKLHATACDRHNTRIIRRRAISCSIRHRCGWTQQ
jgi:hypothetical protein